MNEFGEPVPSGCALPMEIPCLPLSSTAETDRFRVGDGFELTGGDLRTLANCAYVSVSLPEKTSAARSEVCVCVKNVYV